MLFNTFQFVAFLLVVFSVDALLPRKCRTPFLLAASLYFYMCWMPQYVVLILIAMAINFLAALAIDGSSSPNRRRVILAGALIPTFGMLFVYKYLDFVVSTINNLLHRCGAQFEAPLIHLILPAGISFFTFQTASYTIDVFRRQMQPERDPIRFATFISFFPQLVAGPIERAEHLLPQIRDDRQVTLENITVGCRWILLGLFKKMVVADTCSVLVHTIFDMPTSYPGPILILGSIFFAFQVYGDFSGYSDIAVGVARLFDVRLMQNFRQPYMARSVAEYWQRWHISLTSWFRDYIYLPLGGNRVRPLRWAMNVSAVFILSGAWHGANWTFIAWGALHSIYFLAQHYWTPIYRRITRSLSLDLVPFLLPLVEWLTMWALVLFGYFFFRARTMDRAVYMATHVFDFRGFHPESLLQIGVPKMEIGFLFIWMLLLLGIDYVMAFQPRWAMKLWGYRPVRWFVYMTGFWIIALFGVFENVEFIYFQF
jgi:alginate O-acetyltransferase complex protein AlgI